MHWVPQKSKQDLHQRSSSPARGGMGWDTTPSTELGASLGLWLSSKSISASAGAAQPRSSRENIKTQQQAAKIPVLREPGGLILILLPPPAWRVSCSPRRRSWLSPQRCEGAGEVFCRRDPALGSSTGSVWCHSLGGNGRSQGSERSRHREWLQHREGGTLRARRELVPCIQLTQSPY